MIASRLKMDRWEYRLYGDILIEKDIPVNCPEHWPASFVGRKGFGMEGKGAYYVDHENHVVEVRFMTMRENMKYVFEKIIRLISTKINGGSYASRKPALRQGEESEVG